MTVLAADPVPAVGPPWLTITLIVLASLAALITACMPWAVEKLKQRSTAKPAVDAATSTAVGRADKALDLLEDTMRDLRDQRDDAEAEVRRLQRLLHRRESELRRRGWEGPR